MGDFVKGKAVRVEVVPVVVVDQHRLDTDRAQQHCGKQGHRLLLALSVAHPCKGRGTQHAERLARLATLCYRATIACWTRAPTSTALPQRKPDRVVGETEKPGSIRPPEGRDGAAET